MPRIPLPQRYPFELDDEELAKGVQGLGRERAAARADDPGCA
jgi:hypothetical protein